MRVVFLNTDVFRLSSSSGVTRMSRKGMDPSSLVSWNLLLTISIHWLTSDTGLREERGFTLCRTVFK